MVLPPQPPQIWPEPALALESSGSKLLGDENWECDVHKCRGGIVITNVWCQVSSLLSQSYMYPIGGQFSWCPLLQQIFPMNSWVGSYWWECCCSWLVFLQIQTSHQTTKKKKKPTTQKQKNDHLSPVSAPGTERKPSLRLSISLCSSASQCNVNTKPQNTDSFPRKRQIDDINTNKDQLCSISPPWTTPRVTNVQFAVYATQCFVISSWTVLSLRHDETAFLLLTHLTIIMKTLRIIWCTELRALAEMLHHAVHEAPVLGIENRR